MTSVQEYLNDEVKSRETTNCGLEKKFFVLHVIGKYDMIFPNVLPCWLNGRIR
jgi:hypothetical protein